MTKRTVQVGDRVRYTRRWLRSAGFLTGPVPFMRGQIVGMSMLGHDPLAEVKWDGSTPATPCVLAANLERCR